IPKINPISTPNVFVRRVNIPTANTPANGTPTNPVINKKRSQRSLESAAIRYIDMPNPNKPERIIIHLANHTSLFSFFLPKNLCLITAEILHGNEVNLEEMVECAAANSDAINNPATCASISVCIKYGTTDEVLKSLGNARS